MSLERAAGVGNVMETAERGDRAGVAGATEGFNVDGSRVLRY